MKALGLVVCSLIMSGWAHASTCAATKHAGQKLECRMTYNYATKGIDLKAVSAAYEDLNHDDPSDSDNTCRAMLNYADKLSQLRFSVVADEYSTVWISSYQSGVLSSPEVSANSINGSAVSVSFNLNQKPIKDSNNDIIYSIRFSCSIL